MGIGPSTKETSLHHFRDPLLDIVSGDKDVDLLGVMVVGTPQDNKEKYFVGQRAAAWAEAMRADGVIISVDGWGNSHVDYANTIEEIGKRGIPVVGLSFVGTQAKFVVTNNYMDTIVDFNKSKEGIETQVVGENNVDVLDAKKALAFLKLKMRKEGK
ncbi:glycine/sarcosine/betaine reductase component B subunit [Tepidibacter aestuarii]|uniref:glycine/sarcosine/betaine reductase component B subunit n=1 Tax=Tepidibacter aestuarii TaxID=2925782 RepID=UPI0020C065CD|nr:glycine/sarcosine/betaine reductase component B subunit [Tepidibacter aestuarii]CAH2214452.1 D-proline reductase (dithiol)-stabilizing protein PrdE [Tepidibacter aestuarii]